MARTRNEQTAIREERTRRYAESVAVVFDLHDAGVSRSQLAREAEVPETAIGGLMVWMRKNATEVSRTATCLHIGVEWIYGWAQVLRDHLLEHSKRRKNEARALAVTIETLEQSCSEQPDSLALRRQLASAKARLIVVEQEIEEAAGLLSTLRKASA